jgi:hypothetical protein
MLSPTLTMVLREWLSRYIHGVLFGASRVANLGSRRFLDLIFGAIVVGKNKRERDEDKEELKGNVNKTTKGTGGKESPNCTIT